MKGNFWRKIFRCGYNANYPKGTAARYNGSMSKADANPTRTKLRNLLNSITNED